MHDNPPFFKVDCVVTDPPYGRSSSTLKSTTKQLVQEVLASSLVLAGGGATDLYSSSHTGEWIRRSGPHGEGFSRDILKVLDTKP